VEVADERERRARGPVQVVEDEQDGGVGGAAVQQLDRGAEEQVALGLGVGRLGQRDVVERGRKLRDEPGELAAVHGHVVAEQALGHDVDQVRERLTPGLVGHAGLVVAAAVEHGRAAVAGLVRELHRQSGLADARLPAHEHQPSLAPAGGRPGRSELLALGHPPDEAGLPGVAQARRQRRRARLGRQTLPLDAPRRHRLRQPLEHDRAERVHGGGVGRGGEQVHGLGDEDLPTIGGGAQPRRLDRGLSEPVVGLARGIADRDAHAQHERRRRGPIAALKPLLHRDRAAQRGPHALERDHDAVAEGLDLVAAGGRDGLAQDPEVLAPQGVALVGREARLQRRRTDEVGEQ